MHAERTVHKQGPRSGTGNGKLTSVRRNNGSEPTDKVPAIAPDTDTSYTLIQLYTDRLQAVEGNAEVYAPPSHVDIVLASIHADTAASMHALSATYTGANL